MTHCNSSLRISFLSGLLFLLFALPIFAQDYRIGEGDVLSIAVYEHPDLNTTAQVSGEGTIIFPLINEIKVLGKTNATITQQIEKALADGYIVKPQVTIFVKEYRSRKATILGNVKKPALYELRGVTTLLELISEAEGLSDTAGNYAYITRHKHSPEASSPPSQPDKATAQNQDKIIVLTKDTTSSEIVLKINLKDLMENGDTSQNIEIQDGDSVFITEIKKIFVTGEVKRSDTYEHEEGMSVIKAITNAGGFSDKAAPKKVKIIRFVEGKKYVLERVNMDEIILPNDVIVVPESFF